MHRPRFGAHMSIAGEPANALRLGHDIGCDAIQIFTRSPNRWQSPPLTAPQVDEFLELREQTAIDPVVAHSAYLINLATPNDELWLRSIDAAVDEMQRCHRLGVRDYIIHPGAHTGSGELVGLNRIARGLDAVLSATAESGVRILLETTSGAGTHLGYRFEQLAWLIEHTEFKDRLGVCLDTAHIFGAGYRISDRSSYRSMWSEFGAIIGLDRLGVIHLNDSKKEWGSRGDRHEHLGEGLIGITAFHMLVNDPRLAHVPMILETPKSKDLADDVRNLALLHSLVEGNEMSDTNGDRDESLSL